jgi:hypothetical protein
LSADPKYRLAASFDDVENARACDYVEESNSFVVGRDLAAVITAVGSGLK